MTIRDEAGRLLGEENPTPRPSGPWDSNAAVEPTMVVVCGWCPDVREKTMAAKSAGHVVSHGMCPHCVRQFENLAKKES